MTEHAFQVVRRPLSLKADLETKVERAQQVVEQERRLARVKAVLSVLKAEPQAVQEGVMVGLRAMLGRTYAKPSESRKTSRPTAMTVTVAAFRTRAA